MELSEEYRKLVELIKTTARSRSEKLTNEQIAGNLKINKTHFSEMINGKVEVKQIHLDALKFRFASYLGQEAGKPSPGNPQNPFTSLLLALFDDYCERVSQLEGSSPDQIKKDVRKRASRTLGDLDKWLPEDSGQ